MSELVIVSLLRLATNVMCIRKSLQIIYSATDNLAASPAQATNKEIMYRISGLIALEFLVLMHKA